MATVRIQNEELRRQGVYYEFDNASRPLGQGGMGIVYLGWCFNAYSGTQRQVAIKEMHDGVPQHVIDRAKREASVQLRNDNLVEMLGFVEIRSQDSLGMPTVRYYVISEYLHGVSLEKLLQGKVTDAFDQVIPFAQQLHGQLLNDRYNFAITVVRSVLSGLSALHDYGFIHRDIDPSNIMVTSDGHIKLIDFGIAKNVKNLANTKDSYTIPGQFIGKPKYAAPELAQGLLDSQGPVTDIYAMGILLFQLVTGKLPFDGEMAEVIDCQINKAIPMHDVKQKELRNVIKTATRKKRAQRYQSAAEFRVAIDRLVGLPYPKKELPIKIIAAAAVALLLCIGSVLVFSHKEKINEGELAQEETTDVNVPEEESKEEETPSEYEQCLAQLKDPATAQDALAQLQTLTSSTDADTKFKATYLLSRIHFRSQQPQDAGDVDPEVTQIQTALGANLKINNEYAHQLLEQAVQINPNDYRALYELGCDFKAPLNRRGAPKDINLSKEYLKQAKALAEEAGDQVYISKINKRN